MTLSPALRRLPWWSPLRIPRWILYLVLIGSALIMIYPILWMVASSLKPQALIFSDPGLIPAEWAPENYIRGWEGVAGVGFGWFFLNSFVVAALAVAGNIISCSIAAYAFARLDFRFKKLWFTLMLSTIMLPYHAVLVPQYVMFYGLNWVDTYLPLVVPKFLATDAFFIFLMVQFMRSIPIELDEAARIDGCGVYRIYLRIILPLSAPALITTALFTFIWTWDDFLTQLVYLSDPSLYTVTLGLRQFLDATGQSAWGPMFAMSVLSLVPVTAVFLIFQRRLVEGIATTGLKG
jgi:multiple sugar transport system permease protein